MKISITLEALTGAFVTDMKRAEREAQRAAKEIEKGFIQLGKAIGASVATSVTAISVLTKSAINNADAMTKMAQGVGLTVESLSTLSYAAARSGADTEKLRASMTILAKNASDMAAGTGEARVAFQALGISVKDSNGNLKGTEDLLLELADKFSGYEDSAQKTALAVKLFGEAGAQLIPFLNQGAEGIAELQNRARALGLEISGKTGKEAEAFNDLMADAGDLVKGFANDIAKELLPVLVDSEKRFVDSGLALRESLTKEGWVGKSIEGLRELLSYLDDVAVFLATRFAVAGVITATNALGGMVLSVTALTNGLRALIATIAVTPLGFVATAAAVAAVALYNMADAEKDVREATERADDAIRRATEGLEDNAEEARKRVIGLRDEASARLEVARATLEQMKAQLSAERAAGIGQRDSGGAGMMMENVERELAGLNAEIARYNDELQQRAIDGTLALADEVGRLGENAKTTAPGIEGNAKAVRELWAGYDDCAVALALLNDEFKKGEAANVQTKRFKAQADALKNEIRYLGMASNARKAFAIKIQAASMAIGEDGKVVQEWAEIFEGLLTTLSDASEIDSIVEKFKTDGLDDLIDDLEKLRRELERVGDATSDAFDPARAREIQVAIGDARQEALIFATDAVGAGLSSLKTLAKEGSNAYKAIETAQAAANVVAAIGAIVNQGMGDPYTAFARMAAMAAAVGQLVEGISSFGGGPSAQSAAVRQERQGTGTVLGDMGAQSETIANAIEITADATTELVGINRGMLSALRAMQAGISGASSRLAQGVSDIPLPQLADGAGSNSLFDPFGIGGGTIANRVIDAIFGGEQELIDQGVRIVGGTLGDMIEAIMVQTYQTIETEGGWFHSDSIDDTFRGVSDEVTNQFQLVLESLADAVRQGAVALGLDLAEINAAIAAFQIEEIRISTEGLTGEEAQAAIEAVFSAIFDGLAGDIVPFIAQFQQVGEGLGETLVRVATGVQVTQEAIRQLGLAVEELGPEAFAQMSEGLIAAVGGIEAFIDGMQSFVSAFAPEAHQFEIAQDALTRALDQVGLTLPLTSEGMWDLMQSLDATTAEGQEQIATLLRLAGVASSYYDMLEDRANEALEAERDREQARREYADIVLGMRDPSGSEYQQSLAEIGQELQSTIAALEEAARAAGLQGAREEDLAAAHMFAARRAAQALAILMESGRELATSLYGSALGDIEAQISALESGTGSLQDFGNAITDVANAASDAVNLLLGDLSPLKDAQKLPIALQALRAGQIGQEDVLRIARRLMGSGDDYNRVFAEVQAIGDRRGSGSAPVSSGGPSTDPQLAELYAQRDDILAQQAEALRQSQAFDLAQIIADIVGTTGESIADVLENLTGGRATMEQFAADLGIDPATLEEYIAGLQAATYSPMELAEALRLEFDYFLQGLRDIFNFSLNPDAAAFDKPFIDSESMKPGTPEQPVYVAPPGDPTPGDVVIVDRLDRIERVMIRVAEHAGMTAEGARDTANELRSINRGEVGLRQRSDRRGIPA